MMDELKPCPFCGRKAYAMVGDECIWVQCEKCGCRTPAYAKRADCSSLVSAYDSIEIATSVWNERVNDGKA